MIISVATKEKMRLKKEGEDQEYDQFIKEFNVMSDEMYEAVLQKQLEESEHYFSKLK
jgi:hypothetical protein